MANQILATDYRLTGSHNSNHKIILPGQPIQKRLIDSRIPLVSNLFNLDPVIQGVDFKGLDVQVASNPNSFENFELIFNVVQSATGLTVECTYNTDLFEYDTIQNWLQQFNMLLKGIVDHPEKPIAKLALLTDAQKRQLLVEWNDTQKD